MQVYMDTLATINVGNDLNSTGDFNVALFDINSGNVAGAYPLTWTKLEYTFKGITDHKNIRIGFRHYNIHPVNGRGIGIDQFKLEVN